MYPTWDQRVVKDGSITVILPFVSNLGKIIDHDQIKSGGGLTLF